MQYQIIRSARKTLAMEVRGTQVIIRAPNNCSQADIERFIAKHEKWLRDKLAKHIETSRAIEKSGFLTEDEIKSLAAEACEYIPKRVEKFAKEIGVTYGNITIRCQRTRWGSCTGKGNLNFNCLLMLTPPEVIDCIVVHELCHRREMNHSALFYDAVHKAFPKYDKWHRRLKENGGAIMGRVP